MYDLDNKSIEYERKRNELENTEYKIIWAKDPTFIKNYIYEKIYRK